MSISQYDKTPEAQALIAKLERHAPPAVDATAASRIVQSRIKKTRPANGFRWFATATTAAAAGLIVLLALQTPSPDSEKPAPRNQLEAPDFTAGESNVPPPEPTLEVRLIKPVAGGWLINRGLASGLRVGDTIEIESVSLRVDGVGVFRSRARVLKGKPRRGEVMQVSVAAGRILSNQGAGDGSGGFYVFGADLKLLTSQEAQNAGIEHGTVLQVREVFASVFQPDTGESETTFAAKLGLQVDDLLIEIDGQPVPNYASFTKALGWQATKHWLTARVIRNGSSLFLRTR